MQSKRSPNNSQKASITAAQKNIKIKGKVKQGAAASKEKTQGQGTTQDMLFGEFVFNNPEVPERDQLILKEIEDHRQAVRSQIEFKRHSYQKTSQQKTEFRQVDSSVQV